MPYDLPRLRRDLKPFRLYWFPRLRSTNDHAAALRRRGELFAPAIVLASHQTAGRGRGANTWFSSAGSLTVTFAMPIEEHLAPHQVALVAGLAVRNAVAQLAAAPHIALKWPNDIVCDHRKLAGLLCERVDRLDLIGIGLNLNLDPAEAPQPLRQGITSVLALTGRTLDPTDMLIAIATHLRRTLSRRTEHPFPALLREYDRHHALVGRRVAVHGPANQPPVIGRCQGLDDIGRLILRNQSQTHRITAGHIELLPE